MSALSDTSRAAFESWFTESHTSAAIARSRKGYISERTRVAWRAWQASRWEAQHPIGGSVYAKVPDGAVAAAPIVMDDASTARDCVAAQCRATAASVLASNILVDDGRGTLRELLTDAATLLEAVAPTVNEQLLTDMETVLKISDRKHDAWDAAKAGIAAARAAQPPQADRGAQMTAMVDAAMVAMQNIHPPLRRSDCARLIRAAVQPPKQPQSNLNDPRFTTILFSILVKRLGGTVTVVQDDIDAVAYNSLEEEGREDGSIVFRFLERQPSS